MRPMIADRLPAPAECPLCRVPLVGDVEAKVAILKTDKFSSESTLVDAARSLGCLGRAVAEHAPVLKRHITDSAEAEVRFAALWALGQMGSETSVENACTIATRFRDPDPGIRLEAQQIFNRTDRFRFHCAVRRDGFNAHLQSY